MKKYLLVIVATLSIPACTTERVVERVQAPIVTEAPAIVPGSQEAEINFIEGLVEDHPTEISNLGKVDAIRMGRLMCAEIDKGTTINDLVELSIDYDLDAEFIGSVIRESVENFCPENQWFIDSALNG